MMIHGYTYMMSPYTPTAYDLVGVPEDKVEQVKKYICARRYELARNHAAWMYTLGQVVFSPIAYSHEMAMAGLPIEFGMWEKMDKIFIAKASGFAVLQLDGWNRSVGIAHEMGMIESVGGLVSKWKPRDNWEFSMEEFERWAGVPF